MVFNKKQAAEHFAKWLNLSLDSEGIGDRARAGYLAKLFKVSPQAAGKWLRGDSLPDTAHLISIVRGLSGPATRLAHDLVESVEAIALQESFAVREADPRNLSYSETPSQYVRLPLLAMEAGMGIGTDIDTPPEIIEHLDIAKWWAETNLPKPVSRIKIIVGKGDSNEPLIHDGDIVFVDTERNYFDGEGFYVFNWQGGALIKRLVPDLRSNGLRIESANPNYAPETIRMNELSELHIAGRVVAWYTLRRN